MGGALIFCVGHLSNWFGLHHVHIMCHNVVLHGMQYHADAWGVVAVLLMLTVMGCYLRKILWELQALVAKRSMGIDDTASMSIQVGERVSVKYNENGNFYDAFVQECEGGKISVTWVESTWINHPKGEYVQIESEVRRVAGSE